MQQQKSSDLKKYKSKSLYYKFYFLPLLLLLLPAVYSIYLGLKGMELLNYPVLKAKQHIYNPVKSSYQKYRLYLLTRFSLLRL